MAVPSAVATFTTSALAVGSHDVTAVYSGDANFTTSTSPVVTQNVEEATTTSLTSSPNPSVFGQDVLLNQLATATYVVAPLGGSYLGLADVASHTVRISSDAARHGWYVDPTPARDEEFRPGAPGSPLVALPGTAASGRMDLLTTVLHEMGHLVGRGDVGTAGHADDLMEEMLAPGTRRVDALDKVFASWA